MIAGRSMPVIVPRTQPMAHEQFQSGIDVGSDRALTCDHCAVACLKEPNPATVARCIGFDIDCAEICRLAVGKECVKACRRCAQDYREIASEGTRTAGQQPGFFIH